MKFNCFPKKQSRCLIYSDTDGFQSRLFSDLTLQLSSKGSIFYLFKKTWFGHFLNKLSTLEYPEPHADAGYIGILKKDRCILFEMDKNTPLKVWKRSEENDEWSSEPFLGYQLISDYSLSEFKRKEAMIRHCFDIHRERYIRKGHIHGDFTHFNVLINSENKVYFIDDKPDDNSLLFDHFYFYSYLKQCLERRHFLSSSHRQEILNLIAQIIVETNNYQQEKEFIQDFEKITIPVITGIKDQNRTRFLTEFKEIFKFQ